MHGVHLDLDATRHDAQHGQASEAQPIGAWIAFGAMALMWLAFWAVLLIDHGWIADIWETFRAWPLLARAILTLLLLPGVIGAWVWQTDWPLVVRLVIDAGLTLATLAAFYPRPTERNAR